MRFFIHKIIPQFLGSQLAIRRARGLFRDRTTIYREAVRIHAPRGYHAANAITRNGGYRTVEGTPRHNSEVRAGTSRLRPHSGLRGYRDNSKDRGHAGRKSANRSRVPTGGDRDFDVPRKRGHRSVNDRPFDLTYI